jgi:hypothetical protein
MGFNVEIVALGKDVSNPHQIDVLTLWVLPPGKMAKIRNVNDDLANNRVDVIFDVIEGDPQVTRKLTRIILQNPYSQLDEDHQIRVFAHEAANAIQDDMDTGTAHGN